MTFAELSKVWAQISCNSASYDPTNPGMKSLQQNVTASIVLFLLVLASSASPTSAAWVREKGQAMLGVGASYISANKVYDDAGKTSEIPRFTETALHLGGEYGITERFTAAAATSLLVLNTAEDTALMSTGRNYTGIGDSLVSGRYLLYSGAVLLSAGLELGLPTGNKYAAIPAGDGEWSVLPRLSLAGGFNAGYQGFYLFSAAYHKRTVGYSDEVHAQAMTGARFGWVTLILGLELRQSLKNGEAAALSNNPLYLNNASFATFAPGFVFHANEKLTLHLFYKGAMYVRNILGAPSLSAGVSYVL
ncbi:MAG: hypothetical protein OHK0011_11410 [Turneriella sp.]